MKKIGKIIALTLLLSILVSSLVTSSVFAVGDAIGGSPKTLYDLNATKPTIAGAPAEMALTQKTATNGIKYYTAAYTDGWGVDDGGYTKVPYLQLGMGVHYLKNGWRSGGTAEGTDDTDYLVIDLDISTDTNAFDQIYFQTLFYYGKKTEQPDGSFKGVRTSAQSGHYAILGDSGEDFYVTASSDAETKLPIDVQDTDEWAHVTMIVDATNDTARTMHLYYNGRYVSSRVCMTDNAVYLESLRISLGTAGVAPDLDNESFAIANATVKSFPKGYGGDLAEEKANLGNSHYPLSSFADLGYCLDNLPENVIAEITHADSTVSTVTRISDLDANLDAGDTVKLYRDIARKIVIPGKIENGSVVSDVTFDLNGHSMVEPLALADYEELDWIARDASGEILSYVSSGASVYAKGTQIYDGENITTDTLCEFLLGAFPKGISDDANVKVTFLKDTAIRFTETFNIAKARLTYDLNNNTLNVLAGSKMLFKSNSASARVIIRDGKMVNNSSAPVYLVNAAWFYIVNVDLTANATFCDHRAGTLYFIDSKITAHQTLTSLKSHSGNSSYTVFDGCEMTMNGATPISFGNLRTSSARRGSMNNFAGIYNTTVSGDASLVNIQYFANEWTGADAVALSNQNYVTLDIQDSSISVSGGSPAINAEIYSLTDAAHVFAEGFKAVTNVYLDGAIIDADTIVKSFDDSATSALSKNNVTVGSYSAETNVTVKRSNIKTGNYVFTNTIGSGSDNGATNVTLYDNVRLTSNLWSAKGNSAVNVEFAEGVKLAYSYEADYPYIATVNWTESTLVGNRPESTTVKMSPVFSDGMVLQGHKNVNIYGTCATVGATIEVELAGQVKRTTVGADGKWSVTLDPMEYANGLTLYVNELDLKYPETKINNIHVGEVWMMSGQSNSVYGAYKMEDFAEYQRNANNFDNIYAFSIHQSQSLVEKTETSNSGWYKVDSKTLTKDDRYTGISAIAYVMATRLATEFGPDVAIGVLDINFNGSTVEAWMSPENLAKVDPQLDVKYSAYRNYYLENGVYPSESDVSQYGSYIASGKLYSKMPCACYNAMIAPFFEGYSIRGAIWDQGGANAGSVTADGDGDYRKHFNGVRNTFRDAFGDAELPVFIIQLPPRMSDTFYFRALQYDLAAEDANTYVVASPTSGSTYSANELKYTSPASDSMVHYERKSPVGLALADSVLENVYGIDEDSSPKILKVEKLGNSIIIIFDRELTIDSGTEMLGFEIAGADGEWVKAKATYANKTVTLVAEGVAAPDRVRYGCGECILTLEDGTEIVHNKKYASFVYDEAAGTVTITANGNVYVIDTSDPAVIGSRMPGNVRATNGSALPVFLVVVD